MKIVFLYWKSTTNKRWKRESDQGVALKTQSHNNKQNKPFIRIEHKGKADIFETI